MSNSIYWCFTWNNPDYEAEQPNVWPDVSWGVWQHEVGESGTPHYQGYVVFTQKKRITWLHNNLPEGIHWKTRIASHAEALAYHTKEDTRTDGPWFVNPENEPKPQQGKRSDLAEVAEYVKTHTLKEVADNFPGTFIRNHRGIERYRNLVKFTERPVGDEHKTKLVIYWGVHGSGKSHLAKSLYPNHYALMRPRTKDGGCWWDGYEQQDYVFIDEFFGWMPPDLLCRLVDDGKAQVETKFGTIPFNSKVIVMTSNKDPWHWWSTEYHGMKRRLNEAQISYFPETLPVPVPQGYEPTHYSSGDPLYPPRTDPYAPNDHYGRLLQQSRVQVVQVEEPQRAASSTGQRARDGPTNWYDEFGNDKLN